MQEVFALENISINEKIKTQMEAFERIAELAVSNGIAHTPALSSTDFTSGKKKAQQVLWKDLQSRIPNRPM